MADVQVRIPPVFEPIFKPFRYKVLYGGRGSGKSHSTAKALIVKACQSPTRILCAREFQNSIKESVHKLLSDQINEMGVSQYFDIQQSCIKGPNGSEFAFEGLRHNITKIKSYEGVDACWVEEAQTVSKSSWETLIPTIRKPNSEIWLTFNPELEEDETYQRFVLNTPPGALVIKANWHDNPWFPDVLMDEKEYMRRKDPDAYLNIWEGYCRRALEGAVYANELREAEEEARICNVPIVPTKSVDCFWDLGFADCTSIWFAQSVSQEIRVIDFYQNQFQKIGHYAKELQKKKYVYGTMYLPHDADSQSLGADKTIAETLRGLGFKVQIVPKISLMNGISAGRNIFPSCWIDVNRCADGLSSLRRYRWDKNQITGKWSQEPLHDEHSHAADAWRYMAVGYTRPKGRENANHRLREALKKNSGRTAMAG